MDSVKEYINLRLHELDKTLKVYPWHDKRYYAYYLCQTYFFAKRTTRLLGLASSFFKDDDIHLQFLAHSREEINHDQLVIQDLEYLGMRLEDFPESEFTAAFYQIQHYWIFQSPYSFLGYTLFLEMMAAQYAPRYTALVVQAHGKGAAKFLSLHVESDVGHSDMGLDALSRCNEDQLAQIKENVRICAKLYTLLLEEAGRVISNERPSSLAAGELMPHLSFDF